MKLKLNNGKVLSIKLVKDDNDNIDVVVTKVDGEEVSSGILLTLKSTGRFERVGSINEDIGLELGVAGCLKEEK